MSESTPEHHAIPIELDEEEFFTLLISASMVGHIMHLQSKSFAEHKALNEFYEEALEHADSIIEAYQGSTGDIVKYDIAAISDYKLADKTPLIYLEGLKAIIEENRYKIIPKDLSNIHNELDNFITAIDSAVYKLTFLK